MSSGSTGTTACARIGPWSSSTVTWCTVSARHPAAGFDGAAVRVQARKGRQQRRMDVEQPSGVARHEARREDAHEAGQHHQRRRMRIDRIGQRRIESLARGEVLVRRPPRSRCPAPAPSASPPASALLLITAATRAPKRRAQRSRSARAHDGRHVGAAAGDQDHDVLHGRRDYLLLVSTDPLCRRADSANYARPC